MTATDRAVELVHAAARAASDKLATDLLAFDVSEQLAITDAFLLASASNERQVKAVVDEVEDKLREIGAKPVRREGERDGRGGQRRRAGECAHGRCLSWCRRHRPELWRTLQEHCSLFAAFA